MESRHDSITAKADTYFGQKYTPKKLIGLPFPTNGKRSSSDTSLNMIFTVFLAPSNDSVAFGLRRPFLQGVSMKKSIETKLPKIG